MGDSAAPDRRAMSLHLARTLDEIGLNTLTVKKRREAYLYIEEMENVRERLTGESITHYHFGSQTEGTTTRGLHSDLDTLTCNNYYNVIEDWADWKHGYINLLMLQEDTAPGYCRLQLLRKDVPLATEDLLTGNHTSGHSSFDNKGRVLMNNTMSYTLPIYRTMDRNGPAQSLQSIAGVMDSDNVIALICRKWPWQAEEFTRRRRRHGWPSQHLVEEATRHGVFLVPVGHKLSPTEPLEWRISASMAERHLMFSLNIVHIKCYVVLKLLMKTFVEPRVEKCISSYHCKTALLHCTENTEPGFWREDNLLPCVIKCLEMLRQWVADLFCPQFMICKENLFAGKVTTENRDLLLPILNEIIESDGHVLLRVGIDNLGQQLQTKINTEPSRTPLNGTFASVMSVGKFEKHRHESLNWNSLTLNVKLLNTGDHISVIRAVYLDIGKLKGMIEGSHKNERQAIKSYTTLMFSCLGSLLASFSLAHNKKVPYKAIQLICTAAKYDISTMLKLASVFYCRRKFKQAEAILQSVEETFGRHVLQIACSCYHHGNTIHLEFCQKMHRLGSKNSRARFFAHCVRFSRHEIHCAPPALHQELHRAVGDDMKHRDYVSDRWMVLAVVDCLPYLYYLQYLTYRQLGKHGLQKRSRWNIEQCVREHIYPYLYHRETAWNLLGQCWESDQRPDAAMACYHASLEIRPRNNAANWHTAILWYKLVQNHGVLPYVSEN